MKKILVLGATGHLGANTAVHLKESGYDVIAVGHRISDNNFFESKNILYIGGFSLEDSENYRLLPTDIDAVVHLAGTMPAHADQNPMPYVQSIVIGMVNLCEWLKNTPCKRIIFNTTPSDVCAYFNADIPVKEDTLRSFPKDGGDHAIYAIMKNAAADILEHYKYSDNISSCVFRHLTVYGYQPNPYYHLNGIQKMLPWRYIQNLAQEGKPIEVWGDPSRKKELLYIKDFVSAVRLAIESNVEGIINLPGVKPYTLLEQIEGLAKVFNPKDNKSKFVFCPDKPGTPQNLLELGRAFSEMHWKPEYDWISACEDMKKEMEEEPFALLWGEGASFIENNL